MEYDKSKAAPSLDQWLREAKAAPEAAECGMYLCHNGVVRETARARVRQGQDDTAPVTGMLFDYDEKKVAEAAEAALDVEALVAKALEGQTWVRVKP